jgi:hypothetical protein
MSLRTEAWPILAITAHHVRIHASKPVRSVLVWKQKDRGARYGCRSFAMHHEVAKRHWQQQDIPSIFRIDVHREISNALLVANYVRS